MENQMPDIITISGPPGAGKTTLTNALCLLKPEIFHIIPSHTTRQKRETEENGNSEYVFLTRLQFQKIKEKQNFIWTTRVGEYEYGTTFRDIDEALKQKLDVSSIMIVVPNVIQKLREYVFSKKGNVFHFFVSTHTNIIEQRLKRAGVPENHIQKRVSRTPDVFQNMEKIGVPFTRIENNNILGETLKTFWLKWSNK